MILDRLIDSSLGTANIRVVLHVDNVLPPVPLLPLSEPVPPHCQLYSLLNSLTCLPRNTSSESSMQGQVPRPRDAPDRPRSATPNLQDYARRSSLDPEDTVARPASSQGKLLTAEVSSGRTRTLSNASVSKADGVQYVTLSGRTSPNLSPFGLRKGTRRKPSFLHSLRIIQLMSP